MGFANPSYLFALAGMIIPLAIHLWSKKEGRVIRVGSTQFLPEVESKKSSSIRINEILLLILRMLMIALLALILAEPFTKATAEFEEKAVFIDPDLSQNENVLAVIDSLSQSGYKVYWFLPGFPSYETEIEDSIASYWHLIRDLETFEASDLLVISNSWQSKLLGSRPMINRNISWLTVNEVEEVDFLVSAIPLKDKILVTAGRSNNNKTSFSHFYQEQQRINGERFSLENYSGSVPIMKDTIFINIDSDSEFQKEERYIKAALKAIAGLTQWPIELATETEQVDWYISLKAIEDTLSASYRLKYKPDSLASSLIFPGTSTNEYWLTSRLNEENIIEGQLVTQLFEMIRITVIDEAELLAKYDQRLVSDTQLEPRQASVGAFKDVIKTSLVAYLWGLLLLMLVVERALSLLRKQ